MREGRKNEKIKRKENEKRIEIDERESINLTSIK